MPEPRLEVTEQQAHIYTCCRGVTKAAFPPEVTAPVQYGSRIKAAAVYLNARQLVPEDRVGDIMKDLCGAGRRCPASIVAWGEKKAEELAPVAAHLAALIAQAPVRHLDEPGFRIGGKTQWLHSASTAALTHYRVSEKRGVLWKTLQGGIIVHDHFKPYFTLKEVAHARCNAHHLRELKALTDIEKEPRATRMSRLLVTAVRAVRGAVEQGQSAVAERISRRIVAVYDAIVRRALAFHEQQPALQRRPGARGRSAKRPGHNLLVRLRDFKTEVLRFRFDFAVPFANNQAEQDIRMLEPRSGSRVKMKISGGFRTRSGAETFVTLRCVLSTARKRGWNLLKTLTTTPVSLILALSG